MTKTLHAGNKVFKLDDLGCLLRFQDWEPSFAEAMAEGVGIAPPLTPEHWKLISYLREAFKSTGRTPIVHRACRDCRLKLHDLERLFPAGYHRGACKLAGLNYFDRVAAEPAKTYRIDVHGFLVDPAEWDEGFAKHRAEELGLELTEEHWRVIRHLRKSFESGGGLPPVHATCQACGLELEDLERLFPRGYQRQAVKIAGLTLAL